VHQVSLAGAGLEKGQRWDEAITLYLRGLDADALSESFYQGLMRSPAASTSRRYRALPASALGPAARRMCAGY
jgi:hypothetical protein